MLFSSCFSDSYNFKHFQLYIVEEMFKLAYTVKISHKLFLLLKKYIYFFLFLAIYSFLQTLFELSNFTISHKTVANQTVVVAAMMLLLQHHCLTLELL